MEADSQCGSPAGMGQLIKYFESQSRRLDRQAVVSPSSLNQDFKSSIKFSGVPILPPAITSSRRDELRQFKKDAVLLEKRLRARHRKDLLDKADYLVNQSRVYFPDTSSRQTARQLNFGEPEESYRPIQLPDKPESTSSCSNFDLNDTGNEQGDFGLHTMDSVTSDFMSLNYDSIPRVFSGLALTSVKEQKISYDLDRLSKALNVQDLTSTSGSDLSDTTDFSPILTRNETDHDNNMEDINNSPNLEDRNTPQKVSNEQNSHFTSCFHDNQGTVASNFSDHGKTASFGSSSKTALAENTKLKNIEHAPNSSSGAVGFESTNTSTVTTEGQWSNRSSPKSLRSGVHFASFVTEYINTSASQSFECPTVIKKKISSDQSSSQEEYDAGTVFPVLGDLGKSNRRSFLPRKVAACENISGLLENVALSLDSDFSAVTSSMMKVDRTPFLHQGRCETYSSDKENDVSQFYKNVSQPHKRSGELGSARGNADEKEIIESCTSGRQQKTDEDETSVSTKISRVKDRDSSLVQTKNPSPLASHSVLSGVESAQESSVSDSSPIVAKHASLVSDSSPIVAKHASLVSDSSPIVAKHASLVSDSSPIVAKHASLVSDSSPIVAKHASLVSDSSPIVGKHASLVSDSSPIVAKHASLVSDSSPIVAKHASLVSDSSPIVAKHASIVKDSAQTLFPGKALVKKAFVSDSQTSSKSNTLTNTSESSTVKEDFPKDKSNVSMNIVDMTPNSEYTDTDTTQKKPEKGYRKESHKKVKESHQSCSPKKLNIDASLQELEDRDQSVTPSRSNICRSSYTLSEPSPALVQALGRPETERREMIKEQRRPMNVESTVLNAKQPSVGGSTESPKRVQSCPVKSMADSDLPAKVSMPSGAEVEGKAEHINKYLNQVQFQNSMNSTGQGWEARQSSAEYAVGDEEDPDENVDSCSEDTVPDECPTSVVDVLKSIAESHGSLEQLTVDELLELHQQQMNEKRQSLIRQQQKDMEELFVQQRREVMLLEGEIKAAQQMEKEQQKFLFQNAPENIKVKSRSPDGEYSPVQTSSFEKTDGQQFQQEAVAENSGILSDNSLSRSSHQLPSSNHSMFTNIKIQQKSYKGMGANSDKVEPVKLKSNNPSRNTSMVSSSPDCMNDDSQTSLKTISGRHGYSRPGPGAEAMGIANVIPEFNSSTMSPRLHRIVMRSPLKHTPLHRRSERVVIPPEAYLPMMEVKFDKLTATAKGFLTRLLFKSDKVQELIKTIRDTREFAFSFQTETPIKKGNFTSQDKVLLERIIAQLQAALLDIHEIFFEIPVSERLALIEQTRLSDQDKRAKAAFKDNMRGSVPKISQATLKALERKRRSRDADALAVMNSSRPKTAPARISSPLNNHTDNRAMRPLQGHSQIATRLDTNWPEKVRPDTAKEKQMLTQPKRIVAVPNKSAAILVKDNSDSHKKGSVKLSITANKTVLKFKSATQNKPSGQPMKSWR